MTDPIQEAIKEIDTPERRAREEQLTAAQYPTQIIIPSVVIDAQQVKDSHLVDRLWQAAQGLADSNGDGKITPEELAQYIKRDERISGFINKGGIKDVDMTEGFRTITKADYQAMIDEALKAGGGKIAVLDTNRDGKFTEKDDMRLNVGELTGVIDDMHGGLGPMDPLLMALPHKPKPKGGHGVE